MKKAGRRSGATNAHFPLDKPRGATCKSLIVLNPWLTLNQRVPGSSPGAPTKQIPKKSRPYPTSALADLTWVRRISKEKWESAEA